MFITFKENRDLLVVLSGRKFTGINPSHTTLTAGRYEVERIPNPVSKDNISWLSWLVLKGTLIGHAEIVMRRWKDVIIEDDAPTTTPTIEEVAEETKLRG